ncbi:MAG: tRNA uridine-5-carboxymethylaminomethyl(34) synthesis enzyme MnmG [bacterium]|nr:tRNA uridine-5-carboxymethylaminomethyl(34) synthesis enzyme MnmG [bacterium]
MKTNKVNRRRKMKYDVIVVGAGHAGCEAALASARMGAKTLLITMNKDNIGFMSCNPAIGGIGKGQLVKEIDALGGEMAKAADYAGIQFRQLNSSKGPAVRSSRAQIDRKKYKFYMSNVVNKQKNLDVTEGQVIGLVVKNMSVIGVKTSSGNILSKAVVITPGTFLNGLLHVGLKHFPGGRMGEKAATKLSDSLKDLGFKLLRFKTGTCPRLDGRTIDFSGLQIQEGDKKPIPFSFSTRRITRKQVPCYLTYTNQRTHEIIRSGLSKSPLFTGVIHGTGVRYCPSIEDKIVKFADKSRHQIFLEPEGLDTFEFYPNGLATSLPEDIQMDFLHSIKGLEKAKPTHMGYGIEHDVIDSRQVYPTLETKPISNLYLAGQINGTTGYEEAAAQGLVAGVNAVLKMKGKAPLILDRSTSYIGVLLDDLVTKGTNEPYRMFTSRVEHRLVIREDNADLRLRKIGYEAGLVSKDDFDKTTEKQRKIEQGLKYLRREKISPSTVPSIKKTISLEEFLRRPEVSINTFKIDLPDDVLTQMEIEVKYAGFIQRQVRDIRKFKDLERIRIPIDLDYADVHGLSKEIKEKLEKFQPVSLGQANRISGVTPAAIMILMVFLKKAK